MVVVVMMPESESETGENQAGLDEEPEFEDEAEPEAKSKAYLDEDNRDSHRRRRRRHRSSSDRRAKGERPRSQSASRKGPDDGEEKATSKAEIACTIGLVKCDWLTRDTKGLANDCADFVREVGADMCIFLGIRPPQFLSRVLDTLPYHQGVIEEIGYDRIVVLWDRRVWGVDDDAQVRVSKEGKYIDLDLTHLESKKKVSFVGTSHQGGFAGLRALGLHLEECMYEREVDGLVVAGNFGLEPHEITRQVLCPGMHILFSQKHLSSKLPQKGVVGDNIIVTDALLDLLPRVMDTRDMISHHPLLASNKPIPKHIPKPKPKHKSKPAPKPVSTSRVISEKTLDGDNEDEEIVVRKDVETEIYVDDMDSTVPSAEAEAEPEVQAEDQPRRLQKSKHRKRSKSRPRSTHKRKDKRQHSPSAAQHQHQHQHDQEIELSQLQADAEQEAEEEEEEKEESRFPGAKQNESHVENTGVAEQHEEGDDGLDAKPETNAAAAAPEPVLEKHDMRQNFPMLIPTRTIQTTRIGDTVITMTTTTGPFNQFSEIEPVVITVPSHHPIYTTTEDIQPTVVSSKEKEEPKGQDSAQEIRPPTQEEGQTIESETQQTIDEEVEHLDEVEDEQPAVAPKQLGDEAIQPPVEDEQPPEAELEAEEEKGRRAILPPSNPKDNLQSLINRMRETLDVVETQEGCCRLLYDYVSVSSNINNEGIRKRLIDNDVGSLVVRSMLKHKSSTHIQNDGCQLLRALADQVEEYQQSIWDAGAAKAILTGMRRNPENSRIQQSGMDAIRALAFGVEKQDEFVRMGAVTIILSAMHQHRQDGRVQEQACLALEMLGFQVKHHDEMVEAGVTEAILWIISRHKFDARVVDAAFKVLFCLIYRISNAADEFDLEKNARAVLNSMKVHRDNSGIQEIGCKLVSCMVRRKDKYRRFLMKGGAGTIILTAMRIHKRDVKIQRQGALAIACLCERSNVHKAYFLRPENNAPQVILEAIKTHSEDALLVEYAFQVMNVLIHVAMKSSKPSETEEDEVDDGHEDGKIDENEETCDAKEGKNQGNDTTDPQIDSKLPMAFLEATLEGMQTHLEDERVQEMGLKLLAKILPIISGNEPLVARIIDAIQTARAIHVHDERIQEYAHILLDSQDQNSCTPSPNHETSQIKPIDR